ncbi:MAG: hypothetical protein EDM70_10720 [Candidatus Brocadia sp. AMX2]|nr:MAG: hypothetical protein EDM70_10720 [Candidatus Brocadia sp. AMX2]MBL1168246.1 hypothetical protein [Candidatus Brocadia sp. AMX1]GJQ17801.1 MAG: hypothetical protein HBSIN01_17600 [Candidatus Brocadia sinica]
MPDSAMNSVSKQPVLWGKWTAVIIAPSAGAAFFLMVFFSLFLTHCTKITSLAASVGSAITVCGIIFFTVQRFLPQEKPLVINNQQGKTLWELATEHGIKTRVIRFPNTFPPEPMKDGEILSGLGVPDIRGTMGTFSYYTTEHTAQKEIRRWEEKPSKLHSLIIKNGTSDQIQTFKEGEWSNWFVLKFSFNPFIKM